MTQSSLVLKYDIKQNDTNFKDEDVEIKKSDSDLENGSSQYTCNLSYPSYPPPCLWIKAAYHQEPSWLGRLRRIGKG